MTDDRILRRVSFTAEGMKMPPERPWWQRHYFPAAKMHRPEDEL